MGDRQGTLAEEGFERYRKPMRREQFLDEMDQIIPWAELAAVIEPFYPKGKGAGRPPIGIDLGREPVPDETTVLKFRHLLERHDLGSRLFVLIGEYLDENGLKVNRGTIVDATIINAPTSTKNKKKERDPEMHQAKAGNEWYFGMKAHLGVDCQTKLIHSVAATPANVHDSRQPRVTGSSAWRRDSGLGRFGLCWSNGGHQETCAESEGLYPEARPSASSVERGRDETSSEQIPGPGQE